MLTYSGGEERLIAVPGAVALVPASISPAAAGEIWEAMATGDGFAAVLESLVGVYGASMGALPSFAVVSWDAASGEGRVVVRGPIVVNVTRIDGVTEQVSALGVTTWNERLIPGLAAVRMGAGNGEERFGLRDGVVQASGAMWELSPVVSVPVAAEQQRFITPPPEPEPEPGVEPEAAPEPDPVLPPESEPGPALPSEPRPEPVLPPEPLVESPSLETQYPASDEPDEQTYAVEPRDIRATTLEPLTDETTTYDDLIFGETRLGTVEEAAVRTLEPGPDAVPIGHTPPPPPPPAPAVPRLAPPVPPPPAPGGFISGIPVPAAPQLGDHDGETISAAQLQAMQHLIASAPQPEGATGRTAVLVLPTGERVTLDRHAVVGRRPRAVRATGAVPHLVTVVSPQQDVSRSHVELRVEGASVVAIDLDTTNGTRLLRVGADPVRLQPGEPALLVAGDQLDISDGVVLSFEGL